jgi:hypothetical protein
MEVCFSIKRWRLVTSGMGKTTITTRHTIPQWHNFWQMGKGIVMGESERMSRMMGATDDRLLSHVVSWVNVA